MTQCFVHIVIPSALGTSRISRTGIVFFQTTVKVYTDSKSVVCILFWPDGVRCFKKNRYFLGVSWEWLFVQRCIIIILSYKKD